MSRTNTIEVMYGKEPPITMDLSQILNWYSAVVDPKDAKVYCVKTLGSAYETIDAGYFKIVYPLLRLRERGFQFTEAQQASINGRINNLTSKLQKTSFEDVPAVKKTRVQSIFETADNLCTYLDEMLKSQRLSFDASKFDFAVCSPLEKSVIKSELEDFTRDFELSDFTEYYSVGKIFARKIIAFKNELMTKLTAKRITNRKPRVKKSVDISKVVSSVKFANAYPAAQVEGKPPAALVGATIALVFDMKTRKLIKFHAIDGQKFSFKGTTLQNVDLEKSKSKTLRKPVEQVKEFAAQTLRQGVKSFDSVQSVERTTTGRFNENMVILKFI